MRWYPLAGPRRWGLFVCLALLAPLAQAHTLLIMGDSLSAGYNLPRGSGWVSLVTESLAETHPDVRVANHSLSGETTLGGRARLTPLLKRYQPHWVVIELGANDGLRGYPLATTRQNLAAMIEACQAHDAEVLLLGMHLPPNYGPTYSDGFHAMYGRLAERYDVALVPFFLDGIATNPELMFPDRLHPNARAQPKIVQNVLPHLKALLDD